MRLDYLLTPEKLIDPGRGRGRGGRAVTGVRLRPAGLSTCGGNKTIRGGMAQRVSKVACGSSSMTCVKKKTK